MSFIVHACLFVVCCTLSLGLVHVFYNAIECLVSALYDSHVLLVHDSLDVMADSHGHVWHPIVLNMILPPLGKTLGDAEWLHH